MILYMQLLDRDDARLMLDIPSICLIYGHYAYVVHTIFRCKKKINKNEYLYMYLYIEDRCILHCTFLQNLISKIRCC